MIIQVLQNLFLDAPIAAKKEKNAQLQKLKKVITQTLNATAEAQLRAIALDGKKSLLSKTSCPQTKSVSCNKSKKNN